MDEAQYLADRVAVIASGRIIATGPPSTLAGRDAAGAVVRFRVDELIAVPDRFGARRVGDGIVELRPEDLTVSLHDLTGWAIEHGVRLDSLDIKRPSLEDVYLELTGEQSIDVSDGAPAAGRTRRGRG